MYIILIYIFLINTAGFMLFYIDKKRAVTDKYRISEKALISVSILGGSVGGMLAMRIFHHKTRKKKFKIGIPTIMCVQFAMIIAILFVFIINSYVTNFSKPYLYLPQEKVDAVIIPGARVHGKTVSKVLAKRLDAGYQLYTDGAADKIIVTGDHGSTEYDEVNAMREYLLNKGVDINDIFMDHAGFDTYSSMYRARYIFEVKTAVVASQNYHNERAVYIGRSLGIKVWGYAAEEVYIGRSAKYREMIARVKAFFDVLRKAEPKYLGETIPISGTGILTEG